VALLDPANLEVAATIPVGVDPAGLAFSAEPLRLFVANAGSGDVSVIDVVAAEEIVRIRAGREPFAVAAPPGSGANGSPIAVVSRMAELTRPDEVPRSEITLIDPATARVTRRFYLESCHMSEAAAFTFDGRYLLIPTLRVRNLLPITQVARGWVMSSVLAVVDLATGRTALLPLGDPSQGFPDPSGIAVDHQRRRVWVAAGGSDEVAWLDLDRLLEAAAAQDPEAPERLAESRDYLLGRMPVGRNPRYLSVTAAGLAVAERLDDTVGLYREEVPIRRLPVGPPVPFDEIRRGDAVFHDARYAFQRSFSCRSCHPGGHTDGLTYDFDIDGVGRNVVLNRSLLGVKDTAPFKWIGLNPSLARQCGARFAMVLTRADPFPEAELQALVTYLQSLPPPRPVAEAGRVAGLDSGAVERGHALFERAATKDGREIPPGGRCIFCHSPPKFSNLLKADVGTREPNDSTGEFDVPHLTGIASKAPYLHDGRARSLEEIWTLPGVGDQHGVVTDLNKAELNDMIEYLRTL
jgi:YVTN family beta-propeller protein